MIYYSVGLFIFSACFLASVDSLKCHDCRRVSELKSKDFEDCQTGMCNGDYCLLNRTRLFHPDFSFDSVVTRTCIDKKRADDYFRAGVKNNMCKQWEAFSRTCVCNDEDFCSDARAIYSKLFVYVILFLTILKQIL